MQGHYATALLDDPPELDAPIFVEVSPLESPLNRPAPDQVIQAIISGTGCMEWLAKDFTRWIGSVIDFARRQDADRAEYRMSQREWDRYHDLMLIIMPDDVRSRPGSMHELLELLHLRPERDEVNIIHTWSDGHCVIEITLVRVEVNVIQPELV